TLCGDYLSSSFAFGFSLFCHRSLHFLRQVDVFYLDHRDLDSPGIGSLVYFRYDLLIDRFTLGEYLPKADLAHYRPHGGLGKDTRNHLIIRKAGTLGMLSSQGGYYFDPLHYLMTDGDSAIYERLIHLFKNADNPKLHEWTVRKQEDRVTVSCVFGAKGDMENRYVFDLSKGGMLREYVYKGPLRLITQRYDFEKKSGVWVPKRYKHTNVRTGERLPELGEEITWMENRVNEPLEANEFTLKRLGVQVGDTVHDNRGSYEYDGDEDNLKAVLTQLKSQHTRAGYPRGYVNYSFLPDDLVGSYAMIDAYITWLLHIRLYPEMLRKYKKLSVREHKIIHIVLDIELRGMPFDRRRA
ncbi:hypothetical protein LCGC14_3064010, partial [marine sediment metagenome]